MKVFFDIIFLIIIIFIVQNFVRLLWRMRDESPYPLTKNEAATIRMHPEKPVDLPTYSEQKSGIIMYSAILAFITLVFFLCIIFKNEYWVYWLFLVPLYSSGDMLNLFAVSKDGILKGNRFISWKNIQSFEFVPIDINHKYYGFSKEANSGYELKMKTKGFPVSCVITSQKMKDKLEQFISDQTAS